MQPNAIRPVVWFIQFFQLIFIFGIVPFMTWRLYLMTRDIADMKRLLQALLDQKKQQGAAPSPEPRPVSDPSEPA